ncbi:5-formyltetrahydrofolate cyclo-ligase [Brachybacterium sp. P6-10-X1]|uniref:5-formyltetrahydrofolate cyclo-ligase n=1 Tax=Brachybacterium sp. P6-10-X1 TaxID=1903186 RepID=UPI000971A726|nr:5-formyltetrahydrofolate cyclo-ligase [Brachybacterium sp. P6-10-X1]APX31540.1 5-formyltetrahydrofolate cyclo-ligase [Brachybacterium sp. P6-10-X1]
MDTEAMAARKKQLRTELRARRSRAYGGEAGSARRAWEALQLLDHAAPLLAQVREAVLSVAEEGDGGRAPLVAAYHPSSLEADVMPLVDELVALGARLIFPASAGRRLEWITWDGHSPFLPSPGRGFGPEPDGERLGPDALADAFLVLTPAVAVDRSGTRIGHGAGYYDRALAASGTDTRVVTVIHPDELLEAGSLPRGEHDVPIPTVLTADGLVRLVTLEGS